MPDERSVGKPTDFFVGLVDFFAILLPGAILTLMLYKSVEHKPFNEVLQLVPKFAEPWETIATFTVAAYVSGHLLFVIGSMCLDPLYDWWKESFQVWGLQTLLERLKKRDDLRKDVAAQADLERAIVHVRLRSSAAAAEMDHLEADQKFFRALILVLLLAWPLFLWSWSKQDGPRPWLGLLLLFVPMLPFKIFREVPCLKSWIPPARLAVGRLIAFVVVLCSFAGWFLWTARLPDTSPPSSKVLAPPDTTSAPPNKAWIATVLVFGIALCLIRFFQQRRKYTEFAYRAFLVLKEFPLQLPEAKREETTAAGGKT